MYSDIPRMKQLMRPYGGMRVRIKKVKVTQIHYTGAEPQEMEVK
jgi:hypothetical protein